MVGPEMPAEFDGRRVQLSPNIVVKYIGKLYHRVHDELMVTDKLPDLYVAFNPGLGHKFTEPYWTPTMRYLYETKRPLLITSHSEADGASDLAAIERSDRKQRWLFLLPQMLNPFRSLRPDVHQDDVRDIIWANHSVMVVAPGWQ
eukprot:Unigene7720_Nuclearia_a/m.23713 Unigene7720_Nuclearia_a/g.23713  ORF Unigene7720_Nuclearia_a/g.23713 Unigene7720_Nuclearia_a/m.23713 type:complete len:145 (+) Unigene7720_Nuclearia_a:594-1028(+)